MGREEKRQASQISHHNSKVTEWGRGGLRLLRSTLEILEDKKFLDHLR